MQFTYATIAIVLAAIGSTNATPGPKAMAHVTIMKRTCGTLTGTALTVCQDACKALCTTVTADLGKTLCKEACDLHPLKVRSVEVQEAAERSLNSDLKSVCDGACDVTCNSTVLALDQLACVKKCKSHC